MPERGERDFIPIKLNTAGVMPVIFGQALMFLPLTFLQFLGGKVTPGSWLASLSDNFSFSYNLIYFLLIVGFTYVYTALLLNPQQYAEFLKRQNAFIPGVKQGSETEEYIDNIVTRITLPGAVFLGILAILPAVAKLFTNQNLAMLFGGSSLIIMVGVILDTLQQIESQLLMQKYDGLMQSGKIMGRNTGAILETQG